MVSTDAYLKSSDSAYTANVDISQTTGQVNIGDALVKGQQNYMAVGSKAKFTDDNKTLYSNVIAVGSEGMLSDTYLQYSQYQNSEYFISVINGLTERPQVSLSHQKLLQAMFSTSLSSRKQFLNGHSALAYLL